MDDFAWETLLGKIRAKRCTPFIGAGACAPTLPLGGALSTELAAVKPGYPLSDRDDLMRVAQFYATRYGDSHWPKSWVVERIKGALEEARKNNTYPNFLAPDEPHSVLADLDLPVYLTTNYDDFMAKALMARDRKVRTDFCRWNSLIANGQGVFEKEPNYEPDVKAPLVYHMHGEIGETNSLVLTEDDYIDFLVRMNKLPKILPPRIEEAIKGTSLIFVGYRLADWNFRVLFRWLVEPLEQGIRGMSVTVQMQPGEDRGKAYLEAYFGKMEIRVFWGTAREFAAELRRRLQDQ